MRFTTAARPPDPSGQHFFPTLPAMTNIEVQSRLTSLLDVLEHERGALGDVGHVRLDETVRAVMHLQAAIGAALESFPPPAGNGRRG
jgi:hypothetical protein